MKGVRTGDKGRDKDGEPKGNFEPGTDIKAKATVLAEGCWGHLTGPAIREFDLGEGREPQTWELGVKEVWKVPKPLDRADPHDRPVAGQPLGQVRPGRRHLDLPDEGREDRRRPRLDRLRDRPRVRRRHHLRPRPAADVQDCTRWSRRSSRAASASAGAPRRSRAAATGRCPSSRCPAPCWSATPAAWSTRWRSRACTTAINSGILAAEAIYKGLKEGSTDFTSYEDAIEESVDRQGAVGGAQHAPAVLQGLLHRRRRW